MVTLRRRSEFLRVRGGGRAATSLFVLEGKQRLDVGTPSAATTPAGPRFGFTVTRQMGNAVVRNRIKRRLREAVRTTGNLAAPGFDYVIIARTEALNCDYRRLVDDFAAGFAKVARTAALPPRAGKPGKPESKSAKPSS
jgi:ribonuclease P protein component